MSVSGACQAIRTAARHSPASILGASSVIDDVDVGLANYDHLAQQRLEPNTDLGNGWYTVGVVLPLGPGRNLDSWLMSPCMSNGQRGMLLQALGFPDQQQACARVAAWRRINKRQGDRAEFHALVTRCIAAPAVQPRDSEIKKMVSALSSSSGASEVGTVVTQELLVALVREFERKPVPWIKQLFNTLLQCPTKSSRLKMDMNKQLLSTVLTKLDLDAPGAGADTGGGGGAGAMVVALRVQVQGGGAAAAGAAGGPAGTQTPATTDRMYLVGIPPAVGEGPGVVSEFACFHVANQTLMVVSELRDLKANRVFFNNFNNTDAAQVAAVKFQLACGDHIHASSTCGGDVLFEDDLCDIPGLDDPPPPPPADEVDAPPPPAHGASPPSGDYFPDRQCMADQGASPWRVTKVNETKGVAGPSGYRGTQVCFKLDIDLIKAGACSSACCTMNVNELQLPTDFQCSQSAKDVTVVLRSRGCAEMASASGASPQTQVRRGGAPESLPETGSSLARRPPSVPTEGAPLPPNGAAV